MGCIIKKKKISNGFIRCSKTITKDSLKYRTCAYVDYTRILQILWYIEPIAYLNCN